jgi:hypothetical protein
VWPLTADPDDLVNIQNALAGALGAAPVAVTTDANPYGGVTVRHIQPQPRYITLPVRVMSDDNATLVQRWRDIGWAFAQTRLLGAGTLTVYRANMPGRSIKAFYQSGFDGTPGAGLTYDDAVMTLLCPDPYWQDLTPVELSRKYQATVGNFFAPFPTVSSSQTLAATTVVNRGQSIAFPDITIVGPAAGVTATHLDTGESWTLDPGWNGGGDLTAGEVVTITTRPPAVRGPDGSKWTGALNWPDAVLWGLRPGVNNISLVVDGSGPGTSITLAFTPGYETA